MIPYNHKNNTYSLQKDVVNLIIEKTSPTLWMYFIKDDTLPNSTFHYSKFIQADSLEEAKKKIFFSNISYLFKVRLLHMSIPFANEIINEYNNIIHNDCSACQRFLNILHEKNIKLNKDAIFKDVNLYFCYKSHLYSHISWICSNHIPTKEHFLYILEKHKVNFCIDELFIMVDYFSYNEKRIALKKIKYN